MSLNYARAHNTGHQMRSLLEAASMMADTRFVLVVLGSARHSSVQIRLHWPC
jgi:hypothetical protein